MSIGVSPSLDTCGINHPLGLHFAFSIDNHAGSNGGGKGMLAAALFAQATKSKVHILWSNDCTFEAQLANINYLVVGD